MAAFVLRVIAGLRRVDVAAARSRRCRRRSEQSRRSVFPSISGTPMRLAGASPWNAVWTR